MTSEHADIMASLKLHSTGNVQIPDSTEVKFMRAAIKEAMAEIERLRAALKPFAEAGASLSAKHNDLHGAACGISLNDLRRASAALA